MDPAQISNDLSAFQTPEMDHSQALNLPSFHRHVHSENNVTAFGVIPLSHVNSGLSVMGYPLSPFSAGYPNYSEYDQGISHDAYLQTSSSGSSRRSPPNYSDCGPSVFNHTTVGYGSNTTNPHMLDGSAGLKRKNPATIPVFDEEHAQEYYSGSSSSNVSFSHGYYVPNPVPGPQFWPLHPIYMVPFYEHDNFSTAGEEFDRNVRSRHGHAVHLENSSSSAYQPNNLSHHVNSSGTGSFSHATNQSLAGNSVAHSTMEIAGAFRPWNTNPNAPLSTTGGPSNQPVGTVPDRYGQTTLVYGDVPSYPTVGLASTSSGDGMHSGLQANASSRHSGPFPIIEQIQERSGRARHQEPLNEDDSQYGSDSEDSDMGLDIDNLSYEELLELEESIGSVNTGLSEDRIARCLIETTHHSSGRVQDGQENAICVVCLEDFEDGMGLGRLRCGHNFHASCIRKWLLIKNLCPICKADALPDTSRGKERVSL